MISKENFKYHYIEYLKSGDLFIPEIDIFIREIYSSKVINPDNYSYDELDSVLDILHNINVDGFIDKKSSSVFLETKDSINYNDILELMEIISRCCTPGSTLLFFESIYSEGYFRCRMTGPGAWYFEPNVDAFNDFEMAMQLMKTYGENMTLREVIKAYNLKRALV
jgi:hypothetical protein